MRRQISRRARFLALMALAVCVVVVSHSAYPANAQTGGTYDLAWNSIDGGGTMFSTSGSYSLGGTIGQADASMLSGGSYTLNGGFWGGAAINYNIYLPLVLR